MSDPRLDGNHLDTIRHDHYDAAVDEMLDNRGRLTADLDSLARPSRGAKAPVHWESPPAGGTYLLVYLADGRQHLLHAGINSIGRYAENDVVLHEHSISRRHCIVLVHVTGGCEVYDTASRNGTWVNRQRVGGPVDLLPGDVLTVCHWRFVVAWVSPEGMVFSSGEGSDTQLIEGSSATR